MKNGIFTYLLVTLTALSIASCASVPLSTMWKFRNFSESDLTSIDPRSLSAQLITDQGVEVEVERAVLAMGYETPKGHRALNFPLKLNSVEPIVLNTGWFSDSLAKSRYTFSLTDEGIANFKEMQKLVSAYKDLENQQGSLSANVSFASLPPGMQLLRFSFLVQFAPDQDFITLIDNAEVAIEVEQSNQE